MASESRPIIKSNEIERFPVYRRDDSSWPLFLATAFWMASLLILLGISLFAWALRDGLGSDAVESHGLLALSRFWRDIRWHLCFLVIPIHTIGWLFYWRDSPDFRREIKPEDLSG
jgi:hypothetical protein